MTRIKANALYVPNVFLTVWLGDKMTYNLNGSWELGAAEFPLSGSFAQQAEFLLRYAILAPSGHNTQPWLFAITENRIDVFADRRRALPVVDPYDRELAISCGAAIANLEVASVQFGFCPKVILSPDPEDPDLLARVELAKTGAMRPDPAALFNAITQRRTTRARYADQVPPEDLTDACMSHAKALGINLAFFPDETQRRDIADLVDQGDHIQFDDPAFRRELASWVHSTRLGSRDGMSGTGFGMPDILAPAARFVMRTFDIGNGVAAGDVKKIMEGTPALAVLSSTKDDQDSWVQTGRVLGYVLLELTARGFTASYLNQPIETESLRDKLKTVTGVAGFPQILMRIGKAFEIQPPTVRRDVAEVIL